MIQNDAVLRGAATSEEVVELSQKPVTRDVEIEVPAKERLPFTFTALLFFLRVSAVLFVILVGYGAVRGFWPYAYEVLYYIHLPSWFEWAPVWFQRIVLIAFFVALLIDSPKAFDVNGDWERRNRYRLGKFVRCSGPGLIIRMPLINSWGKVLSLRRRIIRFKRTLVISSDNVAADLQMTGHYRINPDNPERAELDVDDPDLYFLSIAENVSQEIPGSFTFNQWQTERKKVNDLLLREAQEKVGDLLVVSLLGITDTKIVEERVQDALSEKAIRVAEAEGRRDARKIDLETMQLSVEIGKFLQDEGLEVEAAEVAWALTELQFKLEMAGDGKASYIFGAGEILNRLKSGDRKLVDLITELLEEKRQGSSTGNT